MKNIIKTIGIAILTIAIVFSLITCGSGDGNGTGNEGNGGGGDNNGSGSPSKLSITNAEVINLVTWSGQTADLTFTSEGSGEYFYIIRRSMYSAPTEQNLLNQTTSSNNAAMGTGIVFNGKNTINLNKLYDAYDYKAYIIAKNDIITTDIIAVEFSTTAKLKNWTVIDKSDVFGQYPQIRDVIFTGKNFVAMDYNAVYISQDGLDWTKITPSSYGTPYGIAYGNGVVVIGFNTRISGNYIYNTPVIYSEDDGLTWSEFVYPFGDINLNDYNNINLIKFTGDKFIIQMNNPSQGTVGIPSSMHIAYSSDGIEWNSIKKDGFTVGDTISFYDIAYGNGVHIALCSSGWFVSEDGFESTNWTEYTRQWGNSSSGFAIIFDDRTNRFLAARGRYTYVFTDNATITSTNSQYLGLGDVRKIVNTGDTFVAGIESWSRIWYSVDGENWTDYQIPEEIIGDWSVRTERIAYGNNKILIILSGGKIAYAE